VGNAKRRREASIGQCVYCGATDDLSDEHVIPYGLSGDLKLNDASCPRCRDITSKLEGALLRGHWRAQRQYLGLKSRRSKEVVPDLPVTVRKANGETVAALLPMKSQSIGFLFEFRAPTILDGRVTLDEPAASEVYLKTFADAPRDVIMGGVTVRLPPEDKFEIPVQFESADLCRFLAKLAHCYAISKRGLGAFGEFFLPEYILGKTAGILTYVGGCESTLVGPTLPGSALHVLMDRIHGDYISVYIQLFRTPGDPPPIYEVVVGRAVNRAPLTEELARN
jgi:hypothetical protein